MYPRVYVEEKSPKRKSPATVSSRNSRVDNRASAIMYTLASYVLPTFAFFHFPRDPRRNGNFPPDFLLAAFCKHTRKQRMFCEQREKKSEHIHISRLLWSSEGMQEGTQDESFRRAESPRLAAAEQNSTSTFFPATVLHELKTFFSSGLFVYIETHSKDEPRRIKFISARSMFA